MARDQIERFLRDGYAGAVGRTTYRFGAQAGGEDAVQEAVIRAWERLSRSEDIRSVPAWVMTVAANLARTELRRRRSEEAALERLYWIGREGRLDAGAPPGLHDHLHDDVEQVVAELPTRQRQVVVLHYFGDLPVCRIAALLGISEGTVKEALHRARRRLESHLGAYAPAPTPATKEGRTMKGWYLAGSHPHDYEHGIEAEQQHDGRPVAYVRSKVEQAAGFGTLMQMTQADEFAGTRMRFSGWLKAEDVEGWAGLWMRVDGGERKHSLAFDNMERRALKGTTDWTECAVVLDVAPEASAIGLGTILSGRGEVLISGLAFEPVPDDVPTTDQFTGFPPRPQNLDFTEEE